MSRAGAGIQGRVASIEAEQLAALRSAAREGVLRGGAYARLDLIEAKLASSSKRVRRQGREDLAALVRSQPQPMADAVATAAGRGETVVAFNSAGAVRVSQRDGLLDLYQAGHLASRLFEAGMLYRRAHEATCPLGSGMADLGRVRAEPNPSTFGDAAAIRSDQKIKASACERAVAVAMSGTPLALVLLRRVVGEGESLGAHAQGRAWERLVADLVRVLQVVDLAISKPGA